MRLGVALLLSSPVADQVDGLRRALGDRTLGRVPAHITLVPPVNVKEADLGRALAVLRAAAAAAPRVLRLRLGAPTSFLPANPVLYLPVYRDLEALAALAALRDRVMVPPLARPLAWPFVPHVTLADLTTHPDEPDAGAGPGAGPDGGRWKADPAERIARATEALGSYRAAVEFDRVHLLQELRMPAGGGADGPATPRWQPLADVALGPPAIVARGGPLAVELVRSQLLCPEAAALLTAEGVEVDWLSEDCRGWPTMVVTARREQALVGVAGAWMGADGPRCGVLVATAHRGQGIGGHLGAALTAAVNDAGWGTATLRPVAAEDYTKRTAE